MKVHRSQSPAVKKAQAQSGMARIAPAPAAQGVDLFDALDLFLTGLILDRAPVEARPELGGLLAAKVPARGRKKAASFAN